MKRQELVDIINYFHNKKILVIGDLILDVYLNGNSTRLSPEAPVPVVDVYQKKKYLGGAANTACNFRSLGAEVIFCSVIGNDEAGDEAISLLNDIGIDSNTIIRVSNRETIVKTRVVSDGYVTTRFDCGTSTEVDDATTRKLIAHVSDGYRTFDAVVISDYDKGLISERLTTTLKSLQYEDRRFLAIDSKRLPFFKQLAPDFVKPNYDEAAKLLGIKRESPDRVSLLSSEGQNLYSRTGANLVAVTLDKEGAIFFQQGRAIHRAQAPTVTAPHVAGAGDTFMAAFVLGHTVSDNIEACAEIATAAATIAVRKESTSSCSAHELKNYFRHHSKSIDSLHELRKVCDEYRKQGKTITFTNGCFDILHSGHVTYLRCAKELGDVLIVGINTDDSIRRIKGASRPINTLEDRISVLSALSSIDHIVPFGTVGDDTPEELIRAIQPDFFVKGGDYTRDKLPEAEAVEESGGKIVFIPLVPDHSTTTIIKKISSFSEEQTVSANHE